MLLQRVHLKIRADVVSTETLCHNWYPVCHFTALDRAPAEAVCKKNLRQVRDIHDRGLRCSPYGIARAMSAVTEAFSRYASRR